MARPRKMKRNTKIVVDRKRGLTWREIQKKYGFKSCSTAHEIFQRHTDAA